MHVDVSKYPDDPRIKEAAADVCRIAAWIEHHHPGRGTVLGFFYDDTGPDGGTVSLVEVSKRNAEFRIDHELSRLATHLCRMSPSRRFRIEEVKALIKAYEAEAHRQVRRDVADVYCWLLVRHLTWPSYYHVQVPPGPDLRTITSVSIMKCSSGVVRDVLTRNASAAFRAMGYVLSPPAPTYSHPQISYPDRQALSAHRRLEGYGRVKEALQQHYNGQYLCGLHRRLRLAAHAAVLDVSTPL